MLIDADFCQSVTASMSNNKRNKHCIQLVCKVGLTVVEIWKTHCAENLS